MKSLLYGLAFGIAFAIGSTLLLVSPLGRQLEENFGLALLFKLRGPVPCNSRVVLVNIGHDSSTQLGLPQEFEDWPRNVYAELVDALTSYGVSVIAFDIHFSEPKVAADDLRFAQSLKRAGNVILFEKLVRRTASGSDQQSETASVDIETLVEPIPLLADAALALAPFPIPKIPVRINQAWTFKTSAGDIPTLPVVALQTLALENYDRYHAYVTQQIPDASDNLPASLDELRDQYGLIATMQRLRELYHRSPVPAGPALAAGLPEEEAERKLFEALSSTYRGENNIYINYYGPPATLPTYPIHQVLSANETSDETVAAALNGAVVFIGAARTSWAEQKDGFYTVFSQADGLDLSGVELAATVFANLLENRPIKPLPLFSTIGLLLILSLGFCLVGFLLNPVPATVLLAMLSAGSLFAAQFIFRINGIWFPVIIPLILLPAASFLSAILYKFIKARREQKHIEKALKLYLPSNVVDEISRDLSFIKSGDRMVYGVCLFSDAQDYTTLSENLAPVELSALMRTYFEHLFKQVKKHDGLVCNVIGDAMFALWPSTEPHPTMNRKAALAALDILEEIVLFNQQNPQNNLPTRLGLHSGYLLMGNIGAEGHYEYAPVGDIVNTASRIEGLNKRLGTWVLASEEALQGCTGMGTRLMGSFLMGGKTQPVTLYQLLPNGEEIAERKRLYQELFPEALYLFQKRNWQEAESALRECLRLVKDDGPSLFYLELCSKFREKPPDADWQGDISVGK
jgi:adenylate cyclase